MKPEEAEKKWCPMARIILSPQGDIHINRDLGGTDCITYDCMAWIWDTKPPSDAAVTAGMTNASPEYGHCGLVKQ